MDEGQTSGPGDFSSEKKEANSSASESIQNILQSLPELFDYLQSYLATRWDLTKVRLRNILVYALLTILGLSVFVAVSWLSLACLFYGASMGLAELLGNRVWLGFLLIGATLTLSLYLLFICLIRKIKTGPLRKRKEAYAEEIARQREKYGNSEMDRALSSSEG